MRRSMIVAVAMLVAATAAACSGSGDGGSPTPSPAPSGVTVFTKPTQIFDMLRKGGQPCDKEPKLVNGVFVCGPLGTSDLTVSVALYGSPAVAKQQFQAHCAGDTWNLYRDGQSWRAALSASKGTISAAEAQPIATALGTDLVHGCGSG